MRRRAAATCLAVIALGTAAIGTATTAGAATTRARGFAALQLSGAGHHLHVSPNGEQDVNTCADNLAPGFAHCHARVRTHAGLQPALGNSGAYDPAYLESAYNAPSSTNGMNQTIAIVDAYDNPDIETDLAAYRTQFGLPACTTANGCFHKVDQTGGTAYPIADAGWGTEIALDVDMASAICPNCKILLVEADTSSFDDLAAAELEASTLGADVISNSFGGAEAVGDQNFDFMFDYPGIPVVASTGDDGYGVQFPASSPTVIAVGGTNLQQATNTGTRNATETAWTGAGSGCSVTQPKPAWQADGCAHRTVADVSAVADPNSGVWVYDNGWGVVGGTSAAAPIVASMYALAAPIGGSVGSYLYAHSGSLNDITSGSNGTCGGSYLCTAQAGFDGPTGLGTPNGTAAFGGDPTAPTNTVAPSISGTLAVASGSATADPGTWDGTPHITYSYQWKRCDSGGNNCTNIGTDSNSYTPVDADLGSTLRVAVTATNGGGDSAPATSDPTAAIVGVLPPDNTSAPVIATTGTVNRLGIANPGQWSGSAETSHTYQWQQCDNLGSNCNDIVGATAATFDYDMSDLGLSIRLVITKTNDAGSGAGDSNAYVVSSVGPINTAAATMSGSAVEGRTLKGAHGSWTGSGPITLTYRWKRCNASGASCADISTAGSINYVIGSADVGHTLRFRVRATNAAGQVDFVTGATAKIVKGTPLNIALPSIAGTPKPFMTLTARVGAWRGTATIKYAFQWYRVDSTGRHVISGATRPTFIVGNLRGQRLEVVIYATNPIGTVKAWSKPTGIVQ